jgi:hypothetical protein
VPSGICINLHHCDIAVHHHPLIVIDYVVSGNHFVDNIRSAYQ